MLKFGLTKDIDLWPLFYPFEAGWSFMPSGVETVAGSAIENEQRLLAGEIDVALISPITYAEHQADLYVLPTPVRASDLSSDAVYLISKKRPDQYEKPVVTYTPFSKTGVALLKLLATRYYGFAPEFKEVVSEANALESLNNGSDVCILSGEAALKASKAALARGYFAEDLTKAWWILTGLPLPLGLFGLRRAWVEDNKAEAEAIIRKVLQSLRSALQHSREQSDTLCQQASKQSGLDVETLEEHYRQQRYDLREQQLRGLFEFYRRIAELNLAPLTTNLSFFPQIGEVKAVTSPAAPTTNLETLPTPNRPNKRNEQPSRHSPHKQAQAQGLRVIKGGKPDKPKQDKQE